MIKLNDYDKGVKEVKVMMNAYHQDKNKPLLEEDIYFDDRLTQSVMSFQQDKGLEANGVVDYKTWALLSECLDNYLEEKNCRFPPSNNPQTSVCYVMQAKIINLSKEYYNIQPVELNGEYNEETRSAVKHIQRICNLDSTGEIDCKTWNLLLKL